MRRIPRLEDLSLDEKLGQLIVHGAHAIYMSESSDSYRELLRQVRDNRVGGIIWFVSNVYETAWLNDVLQREAEIPLLVSADLEAGAGMRLLDVTFWPPAMAVAATGDERLAEEMGRVTAREAKAVGIHQVFAPVVDVNVDPRNPVINTRSFGEDPALVAKFANAFIRGIQSGGLLATAKHFPGHGDTHVDSHRALPALHVARERLDAVELPPFRAAIDAGVASVMIGHLAVPALDARPAPVREGSDGENPWGTAAHEVPRDATMPATVSRPIVTGLLREELGFEGLIVSDAFDMGGVVEHFGAGEAAVRAIEAGIDQIIKPADNDHALAALHDAVRSGRLPMSVVDAAVSRVLAAKRHLDFEAPSQQTIFETVDCDAHREVAQAIAERSLVLVSGGVQAQPGARIRLIAISDIAEAGNPAATLETELGGRGHEVVTQVVDARWREGDAIDLAGEVLVFALAIRARSGHGSLVLPRAAKAIIDSAPASRIVIAFGSPYLLEDVSGAARIAAWGPQPVMQRAAARALCGEIGFAGRLPVTLHV